MKIGQIFKAYASLYQGKVRKPAQVKRRVEICYECDYIKFQNKLKRYIPKHKVSEVESVKGAICGACFCYLPAKIIEPLAKCPQDKW